MDNADFRAWRDSPPGPRKERLMNKLVKDNTPLVHKFLTRILRFSAVVCEHDDLVQAASIGLWEAIKRYDPDRPTKFSTMAWHWVRYYTTTELSRQVPIRRPRGTGRPYQQVRAIERFVALYGRQPTAEDLGVSESEFDKWSTTDWHFAPVAELEHAINDDESAEETLINAELDRKLHAALESLPPYMKQIALGESPSNFTKQQVEETRERVLEFLRADMDAE